MEPINPSGATQSLRPVGRTRVLSLLLVVFALVLTHTAKADTPDTALFNAVPLSAIDTQAKANAQQTQDTSLAFADYALTGDTVLHRGAAGGGQAGAIAHLSPFPIGIRLGLMFSPRTAFAGGVDVSFPQLHLPAGLTLRVDGDAIIAASFFSTDQIYDMTVGVTYGKGIVTGQRIYFGGGVGPYFADQVRFGGKLILGVNATSRFGAELNVHFPGFNSTLVTLQARFRL